MKTIIEKQSAVLSKMYKSLGEAIRNNRVFKCEEYGVIYYIFMYELMIPCDENVTITGADIPKFSKPYFLDQFHYFGGGPDIFRIANIPDKKDLKEMIKAIGSRYNPVFQVKDYIDDFDDRRPLNDIRYISAKALLNIYEFLDEREYKEIDIYVTPAKCREPYYFNGVNGSGFIMPILSCNPSYIINKED